MWSEDSLYELFELYQELVEWYNELDDSAVGDAFGLMKEASSLQASFESVSAEIGKTISECEITAKATQSRISLESSTKVNDGERKASCNPKVIDGWKQVSYFIRHQKNIDAKARHLARIYYDSKLVYENACRAMRGPVGGEKLVGNS